MKTYRDLSIKIMEEDGFRVKTPRDSGNHASRRTNLLRSQERRFKTTVSPNSTMEHEDLLQTDLVFFDEELTRYREHLNQLQKMDQSIDSTHVVEMEQNLKKVLEMATAMMGFC